MFYFICWVVFLAALVVSVIVAAVLNRRAEAASRPQAVADEPVFDDDAAMEGESFDDAEEVPSVDEFPANEFQAEDAPADDFAAFEQEFK